MQTAPAMRRDTPQWILQSWVGFGLALGLTITGALALTSAPLDMMFMAMGIFFALFSTLALSKMLRDNQYEAVDLPSWRFAVWLALLFSVGITSWGIQGLTGPFWHKCYLGSSFAFLLFSSFTLAKTLRDQHEADLIDKARPDDK